jgi:2-keto-4-pentenoate hydratase
MTGPPSSRALAQEMLQAQDQGLQVAPFTVRVAGFDTAAAYAGAQHLCGLRRAMGWVPVGRKIGFTNASLWPTYGVQAPIWGWMYDRTLQLLDGTAARCRLAGLVQPRIEPEIVFRLRAVPAPGAGPTDWLAAVDWVAHGVEIVQSHYPGWKFGAADTVLDGGLHGRLLVGPRQRVEDLGAGLAEALASFMLTLARDGEPVETGGGAQVLGSPLHALAHLAAVLAAQADVPALQPGEIITTGTVTGAYPVAAGQTWRSRLDGIALPGLEVGFTD